MILFCKKKINQKKKYKAIKDYYIKNDKKPSIKEGQKWNIDKISFSLQAEQLGFQSTWICKRLGTEIFLHEKEAIETFGIEVLHDEQSANHTLNADIKYEEKIRWTKSIGGKIKMYDKLLLEYIKFIAISVAVFMIVIGVAVNVVI